MFFDKYKEKISTLRIVQLHKNKLWKRYLARVKALAFSRSAQRLVDFALLPTISNIGSLSLSVFPLSQSKRSSLYAAKRTLALFLFTFWTFRQMLGIDSLIFCVIFDYVVNRQHLIQSSSSLIFF